MARPRGPRPTARTLFHWYTCRLQDCLRNSHGDQRLGGDPTELSPLSRRLYEFSLEHRRHMTDANTVEILANHAFLSANTPSRTSGSRNSTSSNFVQPQPLRTDANAKHARSDRSPVPAIVDAGNAAVTLEPHDSTRYPATAVARAPAYLVTSGQPYRNQAVALLLRTGLDHRRTLTTQLLPQTDHRSG